MKSWKNERWIRTLNGSTARLFVRDQDVDTPCDPPMRRFIGRGLQIAGLAHLRASVRSVRSGPRRSEGLFMVLGFGGFAIFWIGCRVLGVGVV